VTRAARDRVRVNRWVRSELRAFPAPERRAYAGHAWRSAHAMRTYLALRPEHWVFAAGR
jgi:hypothetical protein